MIIRYYLILILFILIGTGCNPATEREYYPTGEIQYEAQIRNGQQHGVSKKFYRTGELMQMSNWVFGVKEGTTETYYKNGQVMVSAEFKNGYQEGWSNKYDSIGNLAGKTFYVKSVPEGTFETYFLDGKIKSEGEYSGAGSISKTYYYYESGSPKTYEVVKDDEIFYHKGYTEKLSLKTTYFPLAIELKDNFCIELQHSIIPGDSLTTRLYFQRTEPLLLQLDSNYFENKGFKVCTDEYVLSEEGIIEGFLCEYHNGISYGCMPFKYNVEKELLSEFGLIETP